MSLSRRLFLKQLTLVAPATYLSLQPWWLREALAAPSLLPTPDFSSQNVLRSVAGLRPVRTSGVRLEAESALGKFLVHNYGHGGSGFTLAWGSAEEAVRVVDQASRAEKSVAVLGAGVIGLTTAKVLQERGYQVVVYYSDISPNTTSDVAGAQWSPSFINSGSTSAEVTRFHRMLKSSYKRYESMSGESYGISLQPNYIPEGFHDGLQDVLPGTLQPAVRLSRLPFENMRKAGSMITSWLIEPSVFLPKLIEKLKLAGVKFVRKTFHSVSEIQSIEESIVVNCCGLGSRTLFGDKELIAVKGQLVLLKPNPAMNYTLLHRGYIFSRRDAIVVGGSSLKNVYDTKIDPAVTQRILQVNRDFFRG